ncbi:MAG: aminopeptidase P family protein [Elusimicrobia bacterium]|nr:aminopeptidase P family protein [Elusimicrobiota bacterium]
MKAKRLEVVQANLKKSQLEAILITNPVNLFYLFGLGGEECFALITPKNAWLYVSVLNLPEVRHLVKRARISLSANKETVISNVESLALRSIGFESAHLTLQRFRAWKKISRPAKLVPTVDFIENLRLTKKPDELALIRKAAAIGDQVYRRMLPCIRRGRTEQYIANKVEALIREKGCEPAFKTIVASGPGSAIPHHAISNRKLKINDIVALDFGAIYKGYRSDLTRTVFLGKINKLFKSLYHVVLEAQTKAIAALGPGVKTQAIDQLARGIIAQAGYGRYFIHTTGHGVGLETHEAPWLGSKDTMILQPGMVVTVEPGIYIPGLGGVRIEDMVLVTATGHEVLTKAAK